MMTSHRTARTGGYVLETALWRRTATGAWSHVATVCSYYRTAFFAGLGRRRAQAIEGRAIMAGQRKESFRSFRVRRA